MNDPQRRYTFGFVRSIGVRRRLRDIVRLPTDRQWMGYLFFMAMLMSGAFVWALLGGC